MPVERHRLYIAQGTEWVALSDVGSLVGFLAAEVFEAELHIWQLAVRLDDQGRGVGGRLLEAADSFARARNLRSITLTTFADVPWNAPWYSRHGFTVATDDERLAGLAGARCERGSAIGSCEHNAKSTGHFNREPSATQQDESGVIREVGVRTSGRRARLPSAVPRGMCGR